MTKLEGSDGAFDFETYATTETATSDHCHSSPTRGQPASSVRAAGPTARPAHSSTHLVEADLDAAFPGFFFPGGRYPADPLVSRQRRDIGPQAFRSGVGFDGFPKV
jgi:hypothetical protein